MSQQPDTRKTANMYNNQKYNLVDDGYLFSIFLYSEHKETDRQCKALVQSWHFHFKNSVIQRFLRTSVGAAFNASDITPD